MAKKELCFPTTGVKNGPRNPPQHPPAKQLSRPRSQHRLARDGHSCLPWPVPLGPQGSAQGEGKVMSRISALGLTARCRPQMVSWLTDPPEQKFFRAIWSGKSFAWKKQHKNHLVFSFRHSPAFPSIPGEVFLGVHAGRGTS